MQEKQAVLCELENAVKNFDREAAAEAPRARRLAEIIKEGEKGIPH